MTSGAEPLVSIITPSYNMAPFLEETIRSVLDQDYPRIEYIVMDGGSTDGSLEILRKHAERLQYESKPDKGQSDAINQGFLRSRGEIFGFLNADDAYLPGAISTAVRHMLANPGYAGIYGEGYLVDENGAVLCPYPTRDFDPELLKTECFICQPSAFLWREAFAEAGMLETGLHQGLDYDLWIRLAKRRRLLRVPDYLSKSRMHRGAKTFRQRRSVYRQNVRLMRRHFGSVSFRHVYAYCCSLLDHRDGFYEPVRPSIAKFALSLAYGSAVNMRHPFRFWKEAVSEALQARKRGAWPPVKVQPAVQGLSPANRDREGPSSRG